MGFYGYFGYQKIAIKPNGKQKRRIVYIGTTTQEPEKRFEYHHKHGKPNVSFVVQMEFDNADDMLDWEYDEIKRRNPILNKRKTRQNLNIALTQEELDKRKGDSEWCQCCLKRRVNKGYTRCYWCGCGIIK